jgi:hypothetical protein
MVVVPAGSFLMGSPPDEPERDESEGPFIVFHLPNHSPLDATQYCEGSSPHSSTTPGIGWKAVQLFAKEANGDLMRASLGATPVSRRMTTTR